MKVRYLMILSACLFFALRSSGQQTAAAKSFTLNGKTNNLNLDSVSIQYINAEGRIIQQTVPVSNGNFSINGFINQPTFSFLLFKLKGEVIGKRDAELKRNIAYLTPGIMTVLKVPAPGGYLEIQGSKTQQEWKELMAIIRPLEQMIDSISKLNGNVSSYKQKLAQLNYQYFITHSNSYVTADRVKYYTSTFNLDSIKALYNAYSEEIKSSTDGRRLASEIKSREVGLPGTMAYSFNVKDKDDKDISLHTLKGKYILLDFWATWCVPCRASMPQMIELYKKYKNKNFALIGIGDDDKNVKNWLLAIEKDGTGIWPQVLRGLNREMFLKGIDNPRDLGQQYGVRALPTKILIDADGKIIGRFDGQHGTDEDLEKKLAEIFPQY